MIVQLIANIDDPAGLIFPFKSFQESNGIGMLIWGMEVTNDQP
jgi:hypothetical protein